MQYPSLSFSTHQTAQSLSLPPRAIVLSGTLGSGKTTLLNHLLTTQTKSATPGSFVVIENDIGATNTDTARLKTDPTNVLAITAGCICCNDLHSLRAAVSQLREQPEIKTLFIETTGIAKPSAVKELLHKLSIPTLVIVTVDVKHFDTNQILGRTTDTIPHADILALTWTHNSQGHRDNDALTKAMDTIERLLEAKGILNRAEIEAYEPDDKAAEERQLWHARYAARILRIIQQEVDAIAHPENNTPMHRIADEINEM